MNNLGGDILLFHRFSSQDERQAFGGSYFIELQYCRLPQGTMIDEIVSVDAITHWQDDSLYIYGDDDNLFTAQYGDIFTDGIYSNLKSGYVDICGINYYAQALIDQIMEKVAEAKPLDYPVLLDWLGKGKQYHGFYILGY